MIRLILLGILFYLAYSLFRALQRLLPGGHSTPPPEKTARGEDMVLDPQCGTYIPRGNAVEKVVKGKRHFFCSRECRDAFLAKN
jgi:uncharacterized protein